LKYPWANQIEAVLHNSDATALVTQLRQGLFKFGPSKDDEKQKSAFSAFRTSEPNKFLNQLFHSITAKAEDRRRSAEDDRASKANSKNTSVRSTSFPIFQSLHLLIFLTFYKTPSKPERPARRGRRLVKSSPNVEVSDEDVEMEEVDIPVRDPPPIF
jgi:hypothetical protein